MHSNKERPPQDSLIRRVVRYLMEWPHRRGRMVRHQIIRGASYGVGSGAVSLLVIWYETRR